MNTIKVRYKDVPLNEIEYHLRNPNTWKHCRGKEIEIITPPLNKSVVEMHDSTCEGPYFRISGSDKVVCPHLCEIGD